MFIEIVIAALLIIMDILCFTFPYLYSTEFEKLYYKILILLSGYSLWIMGNLVALELIGVITFVPLW